MPVPMLEKLIIYFVRKTKGNITKIQLVKFLYLSDLYSVKWTTEQLTNLDWRYYKYGPWSYDIDTCIKSLESKGFLQIKKSGDATTFTVLPNCPDISSLEFSDGLELTLRNIKAEWAGMNREKIGSLLKHVYQTEPMVKAQELYKPEQEAPLDLSLEHKKVCKELGI